MRFAAILALGLLCTACAGTRNETATMPATTAQPVEDERLRVVTFNIRYDTPSDGVHAWPQRRENVVALLRSFDADLIGLQEVLSRQLAFVRDELKEWTWIGVGRDDGANRGEFSPLGFRASRFTLVDHGTWWLSDTPETPSVGWDAALPRIATWALLHDQHNHHELLVVNTHFDHRGAEARLRSARLLVEQLRPHERVILMGDFNAWPQSPPHETLVSIFTDAAGADSRATWCGWDGEPDDGARIDWILLRGFSARAYEVPAWKNRERPESDHLPVIADVVPSTSTD